MNPLAQSDFKAPLAEFRAVEIQASIFYNRRKEQLVALAARHALPAIYPNLGFVQPAA